MRGIKPRMIKEVEGMSEQIYTVSEVSERLKVSVQSVRNYIKDGRLLAFRCGKGFRITQKSLFNFIAECEAYYSRVEGDEE